MRPNTLSGRLPVVALVSHYLTNKLMGSRPLLCRQVPKEPHLCYKGTKPLKIIGYYPHFREVTEATAVIPELRVRYLLITLPYAAL